MLGIDLALLVGGAVILVLAVGAVGGRLERRLEDRRRRRQGQRNAEEEQRRLAERCAVCGEAIDPAHDAWDRGRWWHQGCYRDLLR
jgi:hypothetical protein